VLELLTALGVEHSRYGWDVISSVSHFMFLIPHAQDKTDPRAQFGLWPTPQGGFSVADAHAAKVSWCCYPSLIALIGIWSIVKKMVFSSRQKFPKPAHHYKSLTLLGDNILAAGYHEWKRHRKVAAPAFGEVRSHIRTHYTSCGKRWLAEKQQAGFRRDH
jgi:hypothetical protein